MLSLTSKVNLFNRNFCSQINTPPTFGLIFDIDGVVARGRRVIPGVPEVFNKCITRKGKFCIPTVFLTNSSNGLARDKAQDLSEWLKVKITEEQVIMGHGPLKLYKELHDKNVFINGQGPLKEISQELGFKKVVTVEELRKVFPQLDVVDLERRRFKISSTDHTFSKIDVVLLIGEPVRWETSLQLIIDLLLSEGDPSRTTYCPLNYPHIPILACNPDLQFEAEANMPRFGHGAFLLCLESLYKKITGNDLAYTHLVGKPSDVTFRYAQQKILEQADKLDIASQINNLYMIGDNVNTDIFGANLFNDIITNETKDTEQCNNIKNCYSVLVKTGVYNENQTNNELNHMHRDFTHFGRCYYKPNHIVEGVNDAIELIFELEGFQIK